MSDPLGTSLGWLWCAAEFVGIAAFLLGALSAVAPTRSIRLYQWIMAQLNWRVSPIDEQREIRNTKLLGVLLVLLSLAMWWRLFSMRR